MYEYSIYKHKIPLERNFGLPVTKYARELFVHVKETGIFLHVSDITPESLKANRPNHVPALRNYLLLDSKESACLGELMFNTFHKLSFEANGCVYHLFSKIERTKKKEPNEND